MKIAIFATTFFPQTGGAERFVHGLASRLRDKGHEVTVIVPVSEELKNFQPSYVLHPLRWLNVFSKDSLFFRIVLVLNLLLARRRFGFEVLQVVGLYPAGVAALMFKRLAPSVQIIARATGSDIQTLPEIGYGLRLNPTIDRSLRKVVVKFDAVVANSLSVQKEFQELGVAPEKVFLIPNALDLERFSLSEEEKRKVRQRWCGREEARIILSVGRNEERKNFPHLLVAMEDVFSRFENVYCVLVGEGTRQLEETVATSAYKERYIFTGRLPKESLGDYDQYPPQELVDLYLASCIFAFPSRMEGQPNVLLEAMAARLPIVAGDVPGSRDVVENEKTGLLVSLDDPHDFARALTRLLEDEARYSELSARAREIAQKYNWGNVMAAYEKIYTTSS